MRRAAYQILCRQFFNRPPVDPHTGMGREDPQERRHLSESEFGFLWSLSGRYRQRLCCATWKGCLPEFAGRLGSGPQKARFAQNQQVNVSPARKRWRGACPLSCSLRPQARCGVRGTWRTEAAAQKRIVRARFVFPGCGSNKSPHLCRIVLEVDAFIATCPQALQEGTARIAAREEKAAQQSWEARLETLIPALSRLSL